MFGMPDKQGSALKLGGAILSVLGLIFLVGGIIASVRNYQVFIAVLIVFGALFLVIGISLIAVISLEKKWE
jgi:hypothetical protein